MTEPQIKPFSGAGSATIDDFERIDMRVARVTAADPFPRFRTRRDQALVSAATADVPGSEGARRTAGDRSRELRAAKHRRLSV